MVNKKAFAHFGEDLQVRLPPLPAHVLDLIMRLRHMTLDAEPPRRCKLTQASKQVVRARRHEAGCEYGFHEALVRRQS